VIEFALVAAGAVGGAWTRYLVGVSLDARREGEGSAEPVSTLIVNIAGSFLAGLVLGFGPADSVAALVTVGFCGSLTTFSSFAVETVTLAGDDRPRLATLSALGTLVGALAAVGLGLALGGGLSALVADGLVA